MRNEKEDATVEKRPGEYIMSEIKFKVIKDGNEKKYIPLIRKMLNRSLMEIKECLSNNGYIDICSLDNIDGLQHMNELIDELQKKRSGNCTV